MFKQTKSLAFFHYPCVSQKPHMYVPVHNSVCVLSRELLCARTVCVPSIKHFIGFLSKLLQVMPLFNTGLWGSVQRAWESSIYWCLTSTLNLSRPCYAKERKGCSPGSDMAQEGSQGRVRRGGDSVINELV